MKHLCLLSCLWGSSLLGASNSSGPDSPISVGVIESISSDGKTLEVFQGGKLKRTLSLPDSKVIEYVGMPKDKQILSVGYGIKAKVSEGQVRSAKVTLPTQEAANLGADKTSWSIEDIHKKSDDNADGLLDYVEMSRWVYHSPKHGPDKFSKNDKNKDGGLSVEEFKPLLKGVNWYMYSRMTPAEWFAKADADGDQKLTMGEYKTISNSKAHYENHFHRKDTDKNGHLSLSELQTSMNGDSKKKKKK